mmetsp:Transcript_101130/g.291132  ORF Transcript_101130/g.291132 Transcript_101130/m.291132 type:complete len:168 (+) Transcript_101130:77-580(+)
MTSFAVFRIFTIVGMLFSAFADEGVVPAVARFDLQQCQMLYDTMGGPATQVSLALFSPIVKFVVLQGGARCDINWPRTAEACRGTWAVSASKRRAAIETECNYVSAKNICSCSIRNFASDETLVALADHKVVQLEVPQAAPEAKAAERPPPQMRREPMPPSTAQLAV